MMVYSIAMSTKRFYLASPAGCLAI